jgi:hypothetical protein
MRLAAMRPYVSTSLICSTSVRIELPGLLLGALPAVALHHHPGGALRRSRRASPTGPRGAQRGKSNRSRHSRDSVIDLRRGDSQIAMLEADGRFDFRGLRAGEYEISASTPTITSTISPPDEPKTAVSADQTRRKTNKIRVSRLPPEQRGR